MVLAAALSGCFSGWTAIASPCAWHGDSITGFAVSPDGRTLAVAYVGSGPYGALYVVDLRNATARLVLERPGRDLTEPAFSPDGRQLAFVETKYTGHQRRDGGTVQIEALASVGTIAVDGGVALQRVAVAGAVHDVAFSKDGQQLYVSEGGDESNPEAACDFGGGGLLAVALADGATSTLAPADGTMRDALGFVDGGDGLLWQADWPGPGRPTELQRLDLATGNVSTVLAAGTGASDFQPCVAGDGTALYTTKVGPDWQPAILMPPGAEPVAEVPGGAYAACLADGGAQLVFLQQGRLLAMPRAGGPLRMVFRLPAASPGS